MLCLCWGVQRLRNSDRCVLQAQAAAWVFSEKWKWRLGHLHATLFVGYPLNINVILLPSYTWKLVSWLLSFRNASFPVQCAFWPLCTVYIKSTRVGKEGNDVGVPRLFANIQVRFLAFASLSRCLSWLLALSWASSPGWLLLSWAANKVDHPAARNCYYYYLSIQLSTDFSNYAAMHKI